MTSNTSNTTRFLSTLEDIIIFSRTHYYYYNTQPTYSHHYHHYDHNHINMIPSPYAVRSPFCFVECYDDDTGRCDPYRWYQYRRSQRDGVVKNDYLKIITMCAMVAKEEANTELIEKEKYGGGKKRGPYVKKEPRLLLDPVTRQERPFGIPCRSRWL